MNKIAARTITKAIEISKECIENGDLDGAEAITRLAQTFNTFQDIMGETPINNMSSKERPMDAAGPDEISEYNMVEKARAAAQVQPEPIYGELTLTNLSVRDIEHLRNLARSLVALLRDEHGHTDVAFGGMKIDKL